MLVTPAEMRAAEKLSVENGVSLALLMDNAGRALAHFIHSLLPCGKILVLCGNGNNGGDGFVCARYLHNMGYEVCATQVCGKPETELALDALAALDALCVLNDIDDAAAAAEDASVVVDCVFGTGFHGELSEEIRSLFSFKGRAKRVSADIPSGVCGASGVCAAGCFRADYTVAFGRAKLGSSMEGARTQCGKVIVADIGIPKEAFRGGINEYCGEDLSLLFEKRNSGTQKGDFGRVLCVCGSERMPGACALSVLGAMRSGAGLVTAAAPKSVAASLCASVLEATWLPLSSDVDGFSLFENAERILAAAQSANAVVLGCGLGRTDDTARLVVYLTQKIKCPLILDADGINCISGSINILTDKDNIVLTPHPGEAARLFGVTVAEIQSDRLGYAKKLADCTGGVVVLKGAPTLIVSQNGVDINTCGNSGMSRGGSGDVLSGIIAAFAAQGLNLHTAARLGVWVHGKAGDIAAKRLSRQSMLPTDIISALCDVFGEAPPL